MVDAHSADANAAGVVEVDERVVDGRVGGQVDAQRGVVGLQVGPGLESHACIESV